MALRDLEVRYASKRATDYKLADSEGLYILVRPNGSKLSRMKYRFGGKEKLLCFRAYPDVSLADARLKRLAAKVALGQGTDPGVKAKKPTTMTFEAAAREWHKNRIETLEPGHAARLMARLERDAFSAFGVVEMQAVTSAHMLAMLRAVEARDAADLGADQRDAARHLGQVREARHRRTPVACAGRPHENGPRPSRAAVDAGGSAAQGTSRA